MIEKVREQLVHHAQYEQLGSFHIVNNNKHYQLLHENNLRENYLT